MSKTEVGRHGLWRRDGRVRLLEDPAPEWETWRQVTPAVLPDPREVLADDIQAARSLSELQEVLAAWFRPEGGVKSE